MYGNILYCIIGPMLRQSVCRYAFPGKAEIHIQYFYWMCNLLHASNSRPGANFELIAEIIYTVRSIQSRNSMHNYCLGNNCQILLKYSSKNLSWPMIPWHCIWNSESNIDGILGSSRNICLPLCRNFHLQVHLWNKNFKKNAI